MSRHATTRGPAAVTTTAAIAALVVGVGVGIPVALYGITRDLHSAGHTALLAAAVVGCVGDLLFMAPRARRLVGLYLQDLRAWRDARYCRRHNIPEEGLDVETQERVGEVLRADMARLLEQGGAS